MRTVRFTLLVLLVMCISRVGLGERIWSRVGRSPVRPACISDGSARLQHYWDVAAFDWGGVAPLNSWYHPQLFEFDAESALLRHTALALPHEGQGNEDDPRRRLYSRKGGTASSSSLLFTIFGYEELDGENGALRRDSGVMSLTPRRLPGGIRMPRRHARVVNMAPDEAKRGKGEIPAGCGAPFDDVNNIVFAPRQRPHELASREWVQAYRLDASGRLLGRASFSAPDSFTPRHWTTCSAVGPKYGLFAVGSVTPWKAPRDNASLHLLQYQATGDASLVKAKATATTDNLWLSERGRDWLLRPNCATFCDDGRDVYLLVGGAGPDARYGGEFTGGVYVYRLGPLGGPFSLGAPQAVVPLPVGVEQLKVDGKTLLVSSQGLHVLPLLELLASRGVGGPAMFQQHYSLPYDTHGFDLATIDGKRFLFLASGRSGLEIFQSGPVHSPRNRADSSAKPQETLRERTVRTVVRTGAAYRQLGTPSLNDRGDLVCWATTTDGREAIVLTLAGKPPQTVAVTGEQHQSFGRPVISRDGEVAFWAGKRSGDATILSYRQGRLSERLPSAAYRWLREPRIADDGSILFAAQASARTELGRTIVRQDRQGRGAVVFDERSSQLRLGSGVHGDFDTDYDIAPSGKKVVFIAREAKRQQNHLLLWQAGSTLAGITRDLGSPGRDMQLVRFSADGSQVSFRRWADEVLSTCRARLPDPLDETLIVDELVRRRSTYGPSRVNLGEFTGSRIGGQGNVGLSVVQHVQSGETARCLGGQLWRWNTSSQRLEVLAAPSDKISDDTLLNVTFQDSVNARGEIAALLDREAASGLEARRGQTIVIWSP